MGVLAINLSIEIIVKNQCCHDHRFPGSGSHLKGYAWELFCSIFTNVIVFLCYLIDNVLTRIAFMSYFIKPYGCFHSLPLGKNICFVSCRSGFKNQNSNSSFVTFVTEGYSSFRHLLISSLIRLIR